MRRSPIWGLIPTCCCRPNLSTRATASPAYRCCRCPTHAPDKAASRDDRSQMRSPVTRISSRAVPPASRCRPRLLSVPAATTGAAARWSTARPPADFKPPPKQTPVYCRRPMKCLRTGVADGVRESRRRPAPVRQRRRLDREPSTPAKIGIAISLVLTCSGISMMVTPWWKQVTRNTYIAYFPNTNGIYTGDEIRILGVAVGRSSRSNRSPTRRRSRSPSIGIHGTRRCARGDPVAVAGHGAGDPVGPGLPGWPQNGGRRDDPAGAHGRSRRVGRPPPAVREADRHTATHQPRAGLSTLGEFINTAADNLRGAGNHMVVTRSSSSPRRSPRSATTAPTFSAPCATWRSWCPRLHLEQCHARPSVQPESRQGHQAAHQPPNEIGVPWRMSDSVVGKRCATFVADNRETIGTTSDQLAAITTAFNEAVDEIEQTLHVAPNAFPELPQHLSAGPECGDRDAWPFRTSPTPIQFLCGAIQAACRMGAEQIRAKLCVQYLAPIIKNRQYNFPPIG